MIFLTDPNTISRSCAEGMACVYPEFTRTVPDSFNGRALLHHPAESDRVNIIVVAGGGGNPQTHSFVTGSDLADIAINGSLRAAPSAYDIYEAARYVHSSKGYLMIFNNFMGDILNCDMAIELMALDGLSGKMCPFHDDCLSVPQNEDRKNRAGLIGFLYGVKAANACARAGASLEETAALVEHINERTSSVLITMDFDNKILYFGEGISGEPAPLYFKNEFSIESCAKHALDILIEDLKPLPNEKLHILINRTSAGKFEDAYSLAKSVYDHAGSRIPISRMSAGHYMFMTDSYGLSVTALCSDETIEPYLQKRCFTDSFIL